MRQYWLSPRPPWTRPDGCFPQEPHLSHARHPLFADEALQLRDDLVCRRCAPFLQLEAVLEWEPTRTHSQGNTTVSYTVDDAHTEKSTVMQQSCHHESARGELTRVLCLTTAAVRRQPTAHYQTGGSVADQATSESHRACLLASCAMSSGSRRVTTSLPGSEVSDCDPGLLSCIRRAWQKWRLPVIEAPGVPCTAATAASECSTG